MAMLKQSFEIRLYENIQVLDRWRDERWLKLVQWLEK